MQKSLEFINNNTSGNNDNEVSSSVNMLQETYENQDNQEEVKDLLSESDEGTEGVEVQTEGIDSVERA